MSENAVTALGKHDFQGYDTHKHRDTMSLKRQTSLTTEA